LVLARALNVRKIEDLVYERLRARAARHGVSMEEEVRRILAQAVAAPERLGDLAFDCFAGCGSYLELPDRPPHDPLDLK
jgi:plasmid stability protein